jgi:hypothetical protein
MSLARKSNAKYGAKIPSAPSTGAKLAQPAKPGEATNPPAKAPGPRKGGKEKG